jgi:hypothetical protein
VIEFMYSHFCAAFAETISVHSMRLRSIDSTCELYLFFGSASFRVHMDVIV